MPDLSSSHPASLRTRCTPTAILRLRMCVMGALLVGLSRFDVDPPSLRCMGNLNSCFISPVTRRSKEGAGTYRLGGVLDR